MQVDSDTYDLLRSLNMANLPGVKQQQVCICLFSPCTWVGLWAS